MSETPRHDEYCEKLPHRNLNPQDYCQCRERTLERENANLRRQLAAERGRVVEECSWLVECKPHGHSPQWWGFNYAPGRHADWCSDANKAIRFSRKEDAERMRLHIIAVAGLTGRCDYELSITVTEHAWPNTTNVRALSDPQQTAIAQIAEHVRDQSTTTTVTVTDPLIVNMMQQSAPELYDSLTAAFKRHAKTKSQQAEQNAEGRVDGQHGDHGLTGGESATSAPERDALVKLLRERAAHVKSNASNLKVFDADEARCREIAACYLEEMAKTLELEEKIAALSSAGVVVPMPTEIKPISKHSLQFIYLGDVTRDDVLALLTAAAKGDR